MSKPRGTNLQAHLRDLVYRNPRATRRLLRAVAAEAHLREYGLIYGRKRIAELYGQEDIEETEDAWQEDYRL